MGEGQRQHSGHLSGCSSLFVLVPWWWNVSPMLVRYPVSLIFLVLVPSLVIVIHNSTSLSVVSGSYICAYIFGQCYRFCSFEYLLQHIGFEKKNSDCEFKVQTVTF